MLDPGGGRGKLSNADLKSLLEALDLVDPALEPIFLTERDDEVLPLKGHDEARPTKLEIKLQKLLKRVLKKLVKADLISTGNGRKPGKGDYQEMARRLAKAIYPVFLVIAPLREKSE